VQNHGSSASSGRLLGSNPLERVVGWAETGKSGRRRELLPPGRAAFTDPAVDRFRPLLGFCHLEGSDQPFETQLQSAWVSFGEQMRVTYASAEGGSAKQVNDRSRSAIAMAGWPGL
jgi:hypothetical protein